ncbi:hypothetical protein GCM10009760_59570 [Kitasatospora kazusensis]|uniref:SseB protein N-terminal domain-containing protein n=1 Tax=Kitasatospora kazusensis TaxID=407974 RepID=A0ABN3AAM6_9ACTN
MHQRRHAEDPVPSQRVPAGYLLVPVRSGPLGHAARLFRTPLGDRTALAFTTEQHLRAALGPAQPWIALAEPALRALTEPLGVTTLTVDPRFVAPAARPLPPHDVHASRAQRPSEPRPWAPVAATPQPSGTRTP